MKHLKALFALFGLFGLCAILAAACSAPEPRPSSRPPMESENHASADVNAAMENVNAETDRDMGEIYGMALAAFMPIDRGLNAGMAYIAIDMRNLPEIDDTDKERILHSFNDYDVDVLEATYAQLVDLGLYDPQKKALTGVLLTVESTEILDHKIKVEGSKYRSGKGAIGLKVTIERINGKWQVTEVEETWIS